VQFFASEKGTANKKVIIEPVFLPLFKLETIYIFL